MAREVLHFFGRLQSKRPDWPNNMTPHEEKIMEEHFQYLLDLADRHKVLLAGPCFNPIFGVNIMQASSEAEALEMLKNDPSVKGGLMDYTLQPMRASILADIQSGRRYVAEPSERILRKEVIVMSNLDNIWRAWTTVDGVKTFFAADADVKLVLGGPYEIYFRPDAPLGLRGSEDCRILSILPMQMLSFEWNAPPEFGSLRQKRTQVILQFEKMESNKTRVILSQLGWGKGDEWDKLFQFFDKVWSEVLESLKTSFES